MAHCVPSEPTSKVQAPESIPSQVSVDQSMRPVLFEIFGEIWTVQSRLGQGVSASVYQVSSGRAATAAVKEFQGDSQGGDYGYHKERAVLEDIQGHKNIGKSNIPRLHCVLGCRGDFAYCVFSCFLQLWLVISHIQQISQRYYCFSLKSDSPSKHSKAFTPFKCIHIMSC